MDVSTRGTKVQFPDFQIFDFRILPREKQCNPKPRSRHVDPANGRVDLRFIVCNVFITLTLT